MLLGAATTFVVAAYACTPTNPFYHSSGKGFAYDINGDGTADINGVRRFGLRELWMDTTLSKPLQEKQWGKDIDEVWDVVRPLVFGGHGKSLSLDEFISLGRGADSSYGSEESKPPRVYFERRDAGWPLLALRYQHFYVNDSTIESSHVVFHFRNTNGALVPGKFPVFPIWRGLVVNTLVFTAFWYFVIMLIPSIKWITRRVRDKKSSRRTATGICPSCRYPDGHIGTCPECGNVAAW